mgnify:CR=1 FL=1
MSMTGKYYTVKELAALLRVSDSTIRRMIRKGQIKAIKLPSGTLRIPEEEVSKLLMPKNDQ